MTHRPALARRANTSRLRRLCGDTTAANAGPTSRRCLRRTPARIPRPCPALRFGHRSRSVSTRMATLPSTGRARATTHPATRMPLGLLSRTTTRGPRRHHARRARHPANAQAFGYRIAGRGRSHVPLLRRVALVELGTHTFLNWVVEPNRTGEVPAAHGLIPHPQADRLLRHDVWGLPIARVLLRACTIGAGRTRGIPPRELSFAKALRIIQRYAREMPADASGPEGRTWWVRLLAGIANARRRPRRNRTHPRVIQAGPLAKIRRRRFTRRRCRR